MKLYFENHNNNAAIVTCFIALIELIKRTCLQKMA